MVSIYGTKSDSVVRTYSGTKLPDPIEIYENIVIIEFYAGYNGQDTGWKLKWNTFKADFGKNKKYCPYGSVYTMEGKRVVPI